MIGTCDLFIERIEENDASFYIKQIHQGTVYAVHEKKDPDGSLSHMRLSGKNRSGGSVGSNEGAGIIG